MYLHKVLSRKTWTKNCFCWRLEGQGRKLHDPEPDPEARIHSVVDHNTVFNLILLCSENGARKARQRGSRKEAAISQAETDASRNWDWEGGRRRGGERWKEMSSVRGCGGQIQRASRQTAILQVREHLHVFLTKCRTSIGLFWWIP